MRNLTPPPKIKSPVGGNRQGLKENQTPTPKEFDMNNIGHNALVVTLFVSNRPPFVSNHPPLPPGHTAEIIPFPQRKMSAMESTIRRALRGNFFPGKEHRLYELLDEELRRCGLQPCGLAPNEQPMGA